MTRANSIIGLCLLQLLSGCSFFKSEAYESDSPKVSQVELQQPEVISAPLASTSVIDLIERLEAIRVSSDDYTLRKRLAELRLQALEVELAESDGVVDFEQSVSELSDLLEDAVTSEDKTGIAYQLARLKDLGNSQQALLPSQNLLPALNQVISLGDSIEARFRRGELLFRENSFALAALDYEWVSQREGPLQLHALYMLAWVHFKQGDIDSTLNTSMTGLKALSVSASKRHADLKQDLLRLTVMSLDVSGAADKLATLMSQNEKPAWQTDVYRALGDWYLEKSRYADSAHTWATFLRENPLHKDAPGIALQVMNTQITAGFVDSISELEAQFVRAYGRQSEFYALHGNTVFVTYQTELKPMLDRLTQRLHAKAQTTSGNAQSAYLAAASAYETWLVNFPSHADATAQRFLFAEVLEAAADPVSALEQYEMLVQNVPQTREAREAAYAAVLIYESGVIPDSWQQMVAANQRFADLYPTDERAPATRLFAAKKLYDESRFEEAVNTAKLAMQMSLPQPEHKKALLIAAHGAFELQRFAEAVESYRIILAADASHDIEQKLMASIFQLGQLAEASGDQMAAIAFYQELAAIDPKDVLSRDTQFDIAGLYESMGNQAEAIVQLQHYRSHYGAEGQSEDISARLVQLYEEGGHWRSAAEELLASKGSTDTKRLARFRAAELFLQAGDQPQALKLFRAYAHEYPEPVDLRLEAMHHMDQFYQQSGETSKRHFWLRKKRDTVKALASTARTERAIYLASDASFVLAEKTFSAFEKQKLALPLKRSLKKKRRLLEESLAAFEQVIDFGSLEYVSKSNFKTAGLYQNLAKDLMASERPSNLNPLEKMQYELLVEEQAFPFEERAIEIHERNLALGWRAGWTDAIDASLVSLQRLVPGRFFRPEAEVTYASAS